MELMQVRLPEGLIDAINVLVKRGIYATKSDVMRDAVRRLMLERQIGSMPNTGDSVKEIKAIRKLLSKEDIDLKNINKL